MSVNDDKYVYIDGKTIDFSNLDVKYGRSGSNQENIVNYTSWVIQLKYFFYSYHNFGY